MASWILSACSQMRRSASRYPTRHPVIANDFENVRRQSRSPASRGSTRRCGVHRHTVQVGFIAHEGNPS
jgi:hypothetical protein